MIYIIAAIAENNIIGKDNKLIWNLPEDLKRFKKITTGHTIIMGRKTFESLGRILPNRLHVVLTSDLNYTVEDKNVKIIHSFQEMYNYINSDEKCYVIGGRSLYSQAMPYAKKMYITKINHLFEGDVSFPEIDEDEWKVTKCEYGKKDEANPYDYMYLTYERKEITK